MADTDIEWATKVWNPTRGCRRVSLGCGGLNNEGGCYAERQAMRMSGPGGAYEGLVQLTARGPRWTGKGRLVTEKLDEPLKWKPKRDGSRHRIFVDSMSDLFFEWFTNEEIAAVFGVMAACPQHDFLVLTKRPERAVEWFEWINAQAESLAPADPGNEWWRVLTVAKHAPFKGESSTKAPFAGQHWPLPNVWLGTSVENQRYADERIPHLLRCPAAVRFLSCEPLLGPLDLEPYLEECPPIDGYPDQPLGTPGSPRIDWVIVGGESGGKARPCHVRWLGDMVDQCKTAGVPVFVKQLGAKPLQHDPGCTPDGALCSGHAIGLTLKHKKGGDPSEWPAELRVREMPNRAETRKRTADERSGQGGLFRGCT